MRQPKPMKQAGGAAMTVAMIFAIALVGCTPRGKVSGRDINYVEIEQVLEMFEASPDQMVLIDVRSPKAFAAGHLPGAVNIPLPQLHGDDPRLLKADMRIVYASGAVADQLSDVAAKKLMAQGYKNVYNFRGGITAWQERGRELSDGP